MPSPHLFQFGNLDHSLTFHPTNSRVDAFHGPADVFNEGAFAETLSHYGDTLDVKSGAAAIIARMKTCKATNPTYSLSDLGEAFILGETAAFISILGDAKTITADKKRVEYLFRKLFHGSSVICSQGMKVVDKLGQETRGYRPSWDGRGRTRRSRQTFC